MFNNANARVFDFGGFVKFSLYWGWENGEGKLGLHLFDFSMWPDKKYIILFNLVAWVISFSISLDFDWRPNTGSRRTAFGIGLLAFLAGFATCYFWLVH